MIDILHATWSGGRLHFWAESARLWADQGRLGVPPVEGPVHPHPFALGAELLRGVVASFGRTSEPLAVGELVLLLPARGADPVPSKGLAHTIGHTAGNGGQGEPALTRFALPTIAVAPADVGPILDAISTADLSDLEGGLDGRSDGVPGRPGAGGTATHPQAKVVPGATIEFYAAALRMVRHLLAQQRFVPALRQELSGELKGLWQPWLSDERTADRVARLLMSMPGAARAAEDAFNHESWPHLEDFLSSVLDAECRRTLLAEDMIEAVSSRNPAEDAQVAWLAGLLGREEKIPASAAARAEMVKSVRRWISGLEDRGQSTAWRLLLRLREPDEAALLPNISDPGDEITWTLSFHLQSHQNAGVVLDASDIWMLAAESVTLEGQRVDSPQELLLAELARAARLYKPLESALEESEPAELALNTHRAYQFLSEVKPILIEQGIAVEAPEWWDLPTVRLGARLRLESDPVEALLAEPGGATPAVRPKLGLGALVNYHWEISIGGTTLTLKEFEQLAARKTPLVRINGRWVEVRPEDVQAAIRFIQENPGGQMSVGEAIRMAYGTDPRRTGIPIVGLETSGWVSALFQGIESQQLPIITPPAAFHGALRPYQVRGVSWMAFLEQIGFSPCLADDMGLGKTIQLLALLAYERENARAGGGQVKLPPTLLVVPMSVVGNWVHEARRFCPELRVLLHHGVDRLAGDEFVRAAEEADAVITTYALANRDRETLERVPWRRVVLDEAQYIKNPGTKQTQAVRSLPSDTRIALTGTPVENRLSELWSILDFLNPGYLGPAATFRKRFAVPIERYRDPVRGQQLRELVRPFVLRRLKTDPGVAADLPEKLESREFCHLTPEQAELYESLVRRMLGEVERAEGMHRRGLVLSALIRLKQICNHPSQLLKDYDPADPAPPSPSRSGKCVRLLELLDEVLSNNEQALIFTQFRQMGTLLSAMLRHELDRDVLFLHGGTPQAQRVAMVEQFQRADGKTPVMLVSLKAGGVGLNLTAATHVFHFDRWWNPAVENQATDRAHRIGQLRTVQVHKFVVRGTLEERIDEMIELKTELAQNIIGSGERWLTELSTDQLRDILTLRSDAVGDEDLD